MIISYNKKKIPAKTQVESNRYRERVLSEINLFPRESKVRIRVICTSIFRKEHITVMKFYLLKTYSFIVIENKFKAYTKRKRNVGSMKDKTKCLTLHVYKEIRGL